MLAKRCEGIRLACWAMTSRAAATPAVVAPNCKPKKY